MGGKREEGTHQLSSNSAFLFPVTGTLFPSAIIEPSSKQTSRGGRGVMQEFDKLIVLNPVSFPNSNCTEMPLDRKFFDKGLDPKMSRIFQFLTASYNAFTAEEISSETKLDVAEVTSALEEMARDHKVECKVIQRTKYYAAMKDQSL
jgi:hypothetical protein